jgi:ribosomal protein S18 acetylase RimI-like enzyme
MSGNSEWAIRAGTMEESESVLALWHAAETRPSSTDSELALARLLERDPDSLLLAAGDEIIGSLIVGWDGWRGSFYRLAVHPEWRHQGVRFSWFVQARSGLQALGAKRLTAIVANGEYAAAALWDAAGYRRHIGMSRFVRMVGD